MANALSPEQIASARDRRQRRVRARRIRWEGGMNAFANVNKLDGCCRGPIRRVAEGQTLMRMDPGVLGLYRRRGPLGV